MSLKGSCLCGVVRYEVDQLDMPISHCHCTTCRKAHAAAFATTAGVMRQHFRWMAGEWNYENVVPGSRANPAYSDSGSGTYLSTKLFAKLGVQHQRFECSKSFDIIKRLC